MKKIIALFFLFSSPFIYSQLDEKFVHLNCSLGGNEFKVIVKASSLYIANRRYDADMVDGHKASVRYLGLEQFATMAVNPGIFASPDSFLVFYLSHDSTLGEEALISKQYGISRFEINLSRTNAYPKSYPAAYVENGTRKFLKNCSSDFY